MSDPHGILTMSQFEEIYNVVASKDAEITRLRLTDEEREAVKTAMYGYIAWMDDNVLLETPHVQAKLATLRYLLERLS